METVGDVLRRLQIPSTGFVNAMGSPTKLAASELKASRMQQPASTLSFEESEAESVVVPHDFPERLKRACEEEMASKKLRRDHTDYTS